MCAFKFGKNFLFFLSDFQVLLIVFYEEIEVSYYKNTYFAHFIKQ